MDVNSAVINDAVRLLKLDTILLTLLALAFLYGLATALRGAAEGLIKTFPSARLTVYQVLTVLTFLVYTLGVILIVVLLSLIHI